MGPRSDERGNWIPHRVGEEGTRSLQWGRAPMSAEIDPIEAALSRVFYGFNGAALR